MKVSIVGSNSFLGSSLLRKLKKETNFDIQTYGRTSDNNIIFNFPEKKLDYNTLLDSDAIIFCAAAGVQYAQRSDHSFLFELNTFEPIRLFNHLASENYSGLLITFGSYFEIGDNAIEKPLTENEVLRSLSSRVNDYGLSKLLLANFFNNKHKNTELNHYHIRLSTIYGAGENENRIIPYIINSIKNGDPIRLTAGNQIRQYTSILDVTNFIATLLNRKDHGSLKGIYNVSATETVKIKEIATLTINLAEEQLGKKADVEFGSIAKEDSSMNYLALDSLRAKNELGWKETTSLKVGILSYLSDEIS